MTVNTKTVTGRRDVHYDSLDDLLADAESLAAGDVRMVGNWSLGKIYGHLARSFNCSIDGFPFTFPWPMRVLARLLMKKRFLMKTVPSGFQIPKKNRADFIPDSDDVQTGLAELREAVQRQKSETHRVPHPVLGKFTNEEWEQFHCRHAEMHMSFAVPQES